MSIPFNPLLPEVAKTTAITEVTAVSTAPEPAPEPTASFTHKENTPLYNQSDTSPKGPGSLNRRRASAGDHRFDLKKPLSTSSPVGIAAASQVNASRLAEILIANGPLPIRHITNHLSKAITGFSQLSLSKQRRLIMAALELHDPVTSCHFEKIGWGQWAARRPGLATTETMPPPSLEEPGDSKSKASVRQSKGDVDMEDEKPDPKAPRRIVSKPVSASALRASRRESITAQAFSRINSIDGTLSLAITSSDSEDDSSLENPYQAASQNWQRRHSTSSYGHRVAKPNLGFRSRLGSFGSDSMDADYIDVDQGPSMGGFILDAAALPYRTDRGSFSSVLASRRQSFMRSTRGEDNLEGSPPALGSERFGRDPRVSFGDGRRPTRASLSPPAGGLFGHSSTSPQFRSLNSLVLATTLAKGTSTADDFKAMVDENAVVSSSDSESQPHLPGRIQSHSEEPEDNTDVEDWKAIGAANLRLELEREKTHASSPGHIAVGI